MMGILDEATALNVDLAAWAVLAESDREEQERQAEAWRAR
jgi:hypothetical protein